MRNGQNGRRRGRNGAGGGPGAIPRANMNGGARPDNNNRMEVRARGNAHQLLEKYKSLARDAHQAGDRVAAEYYMQHADHYYRVLNEGRPRDQDYRPRQTNFMEDDERELDADGNDGDDADEQGERQQDRQQGDRQQDRRPERAAGRDGQYEQQRQPERQTERPPEPRREQRQPEQEHFEPRDERVREQPYAEPVTADRREIAEASPAPAIAVEGGFEERPRRRRGRPPRARPEDTAGDDGSGGDIGLPDFITAG